MVKLYICEMCVLFQVIFSLRNNVFLRAHAYEFNISSSVVDLPYVCRQVLHKFTLQKKWGELLEHKLRNQTCWYFELKMGKISNLLARAQI